MGGFAAFAGVHPSPTGGAGGGCTIVESATQQGLLIESESQPTTGQELRPMYRTVTRNIEVKVTPRFMPERSSPDKGYFFWAYEVEITNRGADTVQLKTRHWKITDAHGRLQEVRGAGVVGETPVLEPGKSFEYTSGVPLPTPSGFMVGTYGMVSSATGEGFDIDIPAFSLDSLHAKRTIN
jgi:ApaG protein